MVIPGARARQAPNRVRYLLWFKERVGPASQITENPRFSGAEVLPLLRWPHTRRSHLEQSSQLLRKLLIPLKLPPSRQRQCRRCISRPPRPAIRPLRPRSLCIRRLPFRHQPRFKPKRQFRPQQRRPSRPRKPSRKPLTQANSNSTLRRHSRWLRLSPHRLCRLSRCLI